MQNNHRQGRPGAGARALRRAHARRLLVALADICGQLQLRQTCPVARAAYQEIEGALRHWSEAGRKPALVPTKRRSRKA